MHLICLGGYVTTCELDISEMMLMLSLVEYGGFICFTGDEYYYIYTVFVWTKFTCLIIEINSPREFRILIETYFLTQDAATGNLCRFIYLQTPCVFTLS